ncbi:chemotaxis protein [Hyphomicrobium sp. xq]|uniref:Chemotaxis protein methyltransferase n=1 Tax=Hyphomicrobium album TaxID=2665159 RepID=A0A6I3KKA2_9HYPH|nr:protein-glutamate O-methyltransferase [Hyphomicrobium album]MTD94773.1 chemotaxis protein [Hyphomicrobium album]
MKPALANAGKRAKPLIDGEFPLTKADFQQIAGIAQADAGIDLCEAKASLVYSRLTKRLRLLRLESFQNYCALLSSEYGGEERQHMVAALTTNVTRFFREQHHFEHLKAHVVEPLVATARAGGTVRIWSAACSSGEEPYSIALSILSAMPDAASLDVKVLATDIDPDVLRKGQAGVYGEAAMAPVPADKRQRWFTPQADAEGGKAWRAGGELRKLVTFRNLNLIGHWPMRGPFHAIFCRNALIYFKEETQLEVWSRFVPLLAPAGRLYIGHSERLFGDVASMFVNEAITTYRLRKELDA